MVDVTTAQFISLLLEILLFGIFVVLYAITIWILLYRPGTITNRILFVASTIMLFLAAAHLALGAYQGYEAFVRNAGTSGGANAFLSDTHKPTSVAKFALYVTQLFTGDAFMAYRVYIIWNYNKFIAILPVLLAIGEAATGYIACHDMFTADPIKFPTTTKTYGSPSLTVFLALACFSNTFATALVIIRIVRSNRQIRNYGTVVLAKRRNVLEALIQSAVLYSTALIALFVTYAAGINPDIFGIDVLVPLIGVVFTLIIIRIRFGQATREKRDRENVPTWRGSSALRHRISQDVQTSLRVRMPPPTRRLPFKREGGVRLFSSGQGSSAEDVGHTYIPSIGPLHLDDLFCNNNAVRRDQPSSEDLTELDSSLVEVEVY